MLVDDNEIDNFINCKMVEGTHFADQVYIHSSSKSAIEFLKNIEQAGPTAISLLPDIIFLDVNMPMMDGFGFVEEFNKLKCRQSAPMKIIMLTTSTNPADIDRAKRLGVIYKYLNKPLSEEELERI